MTKTKKPAPAVIYCRTASTPAGRKDDTLAAQEAECRDYAAKHGLTIIKVFHDPGISGMSASRPGWQAMMQFLQKTSAPQDVLVRDESRLARDFSLSTELRVACERLGHRVISIFNTPRSRGSVRPYQQLLRRMVQKARDA